jgi:RPA family protein
MEGERKRLVAVKLWIKDIIKSTYIKEEGLRPNYILTQSNEKISRVNLIGTIIFIESAGHASIFIDDGSGKVAVRSFEQNEDWKNLNIGESILVIGRPREYNGEIYILPEIVRKLEDTSWLEVRKRELGVKRLIAEEEIISNEEEKLGYIEDSGTRRRIYEIIKEIDTGQGVLYDEIMNQIPEKDANEVIKEMLKSGEIFELGTGRLKVV